MTKVSESQTHSLFKHGKALSASTEAWGRSVLGLPAAYTTQTQTGALIGEQGDSLPASISTFISVFVFSGLIK